MHFLSTKGTVLSAHSGKLGDGYISGRLIGIFLCWALMTSFYDKTHWVESGHVTLPNTGVSHFVDWKLSYLSKLTCCFYPHCLWVFWCININSAWFEWFDDTFRGVFQLGGFKDTVLEILIRVDALIKCCWPLYLGGPQQRVRGLECCDFGGGYLQSPFVFKCTFGASVNSDFLFLGLCGILLCLSAVFYTFIFLGLQGL